MFVIDGLLVKADTKPGLDLVGAEAGVAGGSAPLCVWIRGLNPSASPISSN